MQTARGLCYLVMVLALGSLASGCGGAPPGGVAIWIDAPLSGGKVNPGEEVFVQTHAYSRNGIAEIELSVDGQPFSREAPSPAGGDLVTLQQTWIATNPGMHTLQVAAFSRDGAASNPAIVTIEVLGQESPTAGSELQAITPSVAQPTTTVTPYIIPITVTAAAPPSIAFNADDDSVSVGECTFLRWQVQNAISVTLDGSPVGNPDARQVCPQQTTSFTLRAASSGGERSETVQVRVSVPPPPPQDTIGPVISNLAVQPAMIFDNPSCGTDRAHITASVKDSGSGVKRVDIYFRVIKQQAQSGQQASLKMLGDEGQGYYIYLGSAELTLSLGLYGGGTVQYYLVAVDKAGNSTQSGTSSFQTETCIF